MAQNTNRRATLIGLGALMGAWWGWPKLAALVSGGPDFEPVPGLPAYRKVSVGDTSGGFDPLFMPSQDGAARAALRDEIRTRLWPALHRGRAEAGIPVATFSDYYCPYCRVLTGRLAEMAPQMGLDLTWHEWPILGPNSKAAAQAALAADRQGAYVAFHKRMMRSRFAADADFLMGIAADIGIDGAQMLADMQGPAVARQLAITDAVAGVLGLPGTPAVVVGRTIILGAVEDATLKAVIAAEREA